MSKILVLCYPKCSTCQKAIKWLQANNVEIESRDITKENPTKDELKQWIAKSGLPISRFFNTSGMLYRDMNLKDKVKTATEDELLDILASNGMIVKRPLVVAEKNILVGFKESEWGEKLL